MANPWQPFYDSLYQGYLDAFPGAVGVTGHPIFRATTAMRFNWVDLVQRGTLLAPWGIVQMSGPTPARSVGPNANYRCSPVLWYVLGTPGREDMEGDTEAALYELDHALRAVAAYTLLSDPVYDVSEANALNAVFIPQGVPYFAGCLRLDVTYGWVKDGVGGPGASPDLPDLGGGLYSELETGNAALTALGGGNLPPPAR